MPRRPRPLSRQNRTSTRAPVDDTFSPNAKASKQPLQFGENVSEDEETQSEESGSSNVVDYDSETEGNRDSDLDAPRVAQWIDEDELERNDDQKTGPSLHHVR